LQFLQIGIALKLNSRDSILLPVAARRSNGLNIACFVVLEGEENGEGGKTEIYLSSLGKERGDALRENTICAEMGP